MFKHTLVSEIWYWWIFWGKAKCWLRKNIIFNGECFIFFKIKFTQHKIITKLNNNRIEKEQRKFSIEYETQKIRLNSEEIQITDEQEQDIQDNLIKEKSKLNRLFNNEIEQIEKKEEVKINPINESDFPEINEISLKTLKCRRDSNHFRANQVDELARKNK